VERNCSLPFFSMLISLSLCLFPVCRLHTDLGDPRWFSHLGSSARRPLKTYRGIWGSSCDHGESWGLQIGMVMCAGQCFSMKTWP
jgi:hypothetical protein